MSPSRPTSPSIYIGIAVLLVLAATAPVTVAAIGAPSSAVTTDTPDDPAVGTLTATLPPPNADPSEIRAAAESDRLVPTDAVHPNGTVVFRLNGSATVELSNDSALGDELQFSMLQTDRSTTPQRLPIRLNTSQSGNAIESFTVDKDRYVVVDLPNATWEYDGEPGTSRLEPRPRVNHGYVVTLEVTADGTTLSRNTTIHLTGPKIAGDAETDAGGVAELNVSMSGTWTATVVVGNESMGYRAALQVVDEDADGTVLVRVDTDATDPDEVFTAIGVDTVRRHPADVGPTTWNGTLQPGEYPLVSGVADPETVAAEWDGWEPVLQVVETSPASATTTPTASPTVTATGTSTPTPTPSESSTTAPGFGTVTTLLGLVIGLLVGDKSRRGS